MRFTDERVDSALRDDDPPAEPYGREVTAVDELVCVRAGDREDLCRLVDSPDHPIRAATVFAANERASSQAQLAEGAGMESVWISDDFHPWFDEQGQSPFVWSVIGAIGATAALHVFSAVTCPTMRIHPAVIAQAAATSALILDDRFALGVGTGENLNEHIFGDALPVTDVRLEMLEEAVEIMRALWTGDEVAHRGRLGGACDGLGDRVAELSA